MKHPLLPRGNELGLPVASGILLNLSFPPFHLLLPPFVALAPFIVFLGSTRRDRAGRVSAGRAAFWMGVIYYGVVLYWLFAALVFYTWLSLLGYLITVVVLSGFLAAMARGVHRIRAHHGVPLWASVPIFWTAVEWLRGHLGDLAFPWLGLGHSLTGFPALVGFADVVGARGVTFWLVAISCLTAAWWLAGVRRGARRFAPILILVLGVPIAYSVARWMTLETRPAEKVMVVQPNIPEDLKLEREAAQDSSRRSLDNLTRAGLAAADDVGLVVWPETALPTFLANAPSWTTWSGELARTHEIGLVFGALDYDRYDDGSFDYYNAAFLVGADGRPAGVYRKHYLVPMVERVPFVPLSWVRDLRSSARGGWNLPLVGDISAFLQYFGGFGRGDRDTVLTTDGLAFGTLICYESIFPSLSRRFRLAGAPFLVNITNDAWFGRHEPWWSRTSALVQHPAHLVMRAIENRIGVARSANTGISLFVDPRGRTYESTDLFEPAVRTADVRTTDEMTVYTRLGDWLGWTCAGATLLILGASTLRTRTRSRKIAPNDDRGH